MVGSPNSINIRFYVQLKTSFQHMLVKQLSNDVFQKGLN